MSVKPDYGFKSIIRRGYERLLGGNNKSRLLGLSFDKGPF